MLWTVDGKIGGTDHVVVYCVGCLEWLEIVFYLA